MTGNKVTRNDVPGSDHVARYCHPRRVIFDVATGALIGLFPDVFKLRQQSGETYLSLNHFEYFKGDLDHQFSEILVVMRSKFKRPPEPIIARLSAAQVIACGARRQKNLRLRKRGKKGSDPSYVALEGLPLDNSDTILLTELASKTCVEVRSGPQIEQV